jgi:hypothetical protein
MAEQELRERLRAELEGAARVRITADLKELGKRCLVGFPGPLRVS